MSLSIPEDPNVKEDDKTLTIYPNSRDEAIELSNNWQTLPTNSSINMEEFGLGIFPISENNKSNSTQHNEDQPDL